MLQFLFYLLCSCSVFVLFLFVLFSYFVSICIVHVLFSFCFQFQLHFIYSIYIYIFKYTYMCIYICMPCSLYKYFQFNNCYFLAKNTYDNVIDRSDPTLLSKFDAVPYKSCLSVCDENIQFKYN